MSVLQAAIEYEKRSNLKEQPVGCRLSGVWFPSDQERRDCCNSFAPNFTDLDRALRHCRTAPHISQKYGVKAHHVMEFAALLRVYPLKFMEEIEQRLLTAIVMAERSLEATATPSLWRKLALAMWREREEAKKKERLARARERKRKRRAATRRRNSGSQTSKTAD